MAAANNYAGIESASISVAASEKRHAGYPDNITYTIAYTIAYIIKAILRIPQGLPIGCNKAIRLSIEQCLTKKAKVALILATRRRRKGVRKGVEKSAKLRFAFVLRERQIVWRICFHRLNWMTIGFEMFASNLEFGIFFSFLKIDFEL